jgi:Putative Actinobacterial Holin-X, holin superfamily III
MGPPHQAEGEAAPRSIAETITEVAADAGSLVRAEITLAGLETRANVAAIGGAAVRIAVGGVLLVLSLTFLTVAGIVALANAVGLLASLLIVAGVVAAGGVALILFGRGEIRRRTLLPMQTFARISDDLDRLQARADAIRGRGGPADEGGSHG